MNTAARLLAFAWLVVSAVSLQAETLQSLIDAAPPGSALEVPAGEHAGPIRIAKPLELRGQPGASIVGDGSGSVVSIEADNVSILGLRISGSGRRLEGDDAAVVVRAARAVVRDNIIEGRLHGIYLKEARDCVVEGNVIIGQTTARVPADDPLARGLKPDADGLCSARIDPARRGNGIHLWNSNGAVLRGNRIRDTRDGIYFSFSHEAAVEGNLIADVRYGLHYMYSDNNRFEGNRFERNAAGAAIMYSEGLFVRGNVFSSNAGFRAYGILAQSVDKSVFIDNALERNAVGLYLENSVGNTLRGNSIARNYVGARLSASSTGNALSRNRFVGNIHSVETDRDSADNEWSASGRGNYWDGAMPIDLDGDGAGELPHREADLLGRHRRAFPAAALLSDSPALRLLKFAHARAKLGGVPAIEDPAPLAAAGR